MIWSTDFLDWLASGLVVFP